MIELAGRATRAVNRAFTALAGVMAVAILAVILYDVVMRNVFGAPTVWALDVSRFLLVYLFFLALAPALEAGTHVSVDVVMHWISPLAARRLGIVATALTILFGLIVLWQVTRATADAFVRDEMFPTAVPMRMKYVYWIGPVGTLQFVLTAIVALAEQWTPSSDSRSS